MSIFNKIINREIPANIVYENKYVIAFKDINPLAPVHILVVPKKEIRTLNDFVIEDPDELLGIWLSVLIYLDPSLTLLVKTPDEIPSMHFYGYDEKKRHLNNPGYGLYE